MPLQQHAPQRHSMRVDVIAEDYDVLTPLAEQLGWSMNKLVREVAHWWTREYVAGRVHGVIPTLVKDNARREA